MSKAWYYKELVSSGVLIAGKQPQFEILSGNRGVIAVDSETQSDLANGLELMATEQRGGIVKISEAEYTEKKTAFPPVNRSAIPSRSGALRVMPSAKDILKPGTTDPAPTADNGTPRPNNPYNPYGVGHDGTVPVPPKRDPSEPPPVGIGQITAPPPGTFETPPAAEVQTAQSPPPAFKPKTGHAKAAAKQPEEAAAV